ncbi:hypothetical protein [Nocardia bovistercoris]|uniref:Uncharacterized protein n=1 Tax=Nocardia bovistercoris TaxID=2785916 RepID=A0A931ID87_9NOCA|nr:hypothetical protein [Nocardia bovistercoris]MBH0777700.1 hypothetical protein [Nocardia bovistercoris]
MNNRSSSTLPDFGTPSSQQYETQGIRLTLLGKRILTIVGIIIVGHVVIVAILAGRGAMEAVNASMLLTSGVAVCFITRIPGIVKAVGELERGRSAIFVPPSRDDRSDTETPSVPPRRAIGRSRRSDATRRRPGIANIARVRRRNARRR